MHNIDENEVLRDALSSLNEDVPPMPEELHASWMQKVEENMEEARIEKSRNRKAFTRFLSVAAAMVFVIGGTLLTRDDITNRARLEKEYAALAAQNGEPAYAATAAEYKQKLAAYDAYDSGIVTASYAPAFGAAYEDTIVEEAAEAETQTFQLAAKRSAANGAVVTEETATETSSTAAKKIIRTASLTIQTQQYEGSLANLKALCEAEGGWIESSSESLNSSTGLRRASLTLRIPQDALDGYLLGAEELGRITSRSEDATDVTASYQDTQSRLETQLALMDRLQALITESADLSDLLALESQIADTQYMIDSLQSALNSTDRQVTYSTVNISLREETAPALTDTSVSLGERIAAAIHMGWNAFAGFTQDMLVFIIAALPFLAIVAAVAGVAALIRRKKRRNQK